MRHQGIWLGLILLLLYRVVLADAAEEALNLEQIVSGMNFQGQAVSNGEAKILFFEVISPTHTQEQAEQWLENKKAEFQSSDQDNTTTSSTDESRLAEFFSDFELQATLKTHPEINRQEYDIAFEAYNFERYKYRSTILTEGRSKKGASSHNLKILGGSESLLLMARHKSWKKNSRTGFDTSRLILVILIVVLSHVSPLDDFRSGFVLNKLNS